MQVGRDFHDNAQATAQSDQSTIFERFSFAAWRGVSIGIIVSLYRWRQNIPKNLIGLNSYCFAPALGIEIGSEAIRYLAERSYTLGLTMLGNKEQNQNMFETNLKGKFRLCCWTIIGFGDRTINKVDQVSSSFLGIRTRREIRIERVAAEDLTNLEVTRIFLKLIAEVCIKVLIPRCIMIVALSPCFASPLIGMQFLTTNMAIIATIVGNIFFS